MNPREETISLPVSTGSSLLVHPNKVNSAQNLSLIGSLKNIGLRLVFLLRVAAEVRVLGCRVGFGCRVYAAARNS